MADRTDVDLDVPRHTYAARARDMIAAIVTGQFAGLAMLATMMIVATLRQEDVLTPLRAIGSIAYGTSEMRAGWSTVVAGFFLHQLGFTFFWSVVYGALAQRANRRDPVDVTALGLDDRFGVVALGPLVGMGSQLIDVVVVMPAIAQGAEWTHVFLGMWGVLYHLVFGLGLATYPWVRRWLYPDEV